LKAATRNNGEHPGSGLAARYPRTESRVTAIRSVRAAEGKFVQISNAALQDRRLTAAARGILAFVLSLPTDQHLTAEWLEAQLPDGRRAIRTALRNLAECGYYRSSRTSQGGTWVWDQVISDAPSSQVSPSDTNRSDANAPDADRSDKRSNTEPSKDVGPIDMASRHAHAKKRVGTTRTIRDAIDGVRAAAAAEHGQLAADDLTDGEALGLYYTYVGNRTPHDIASYLRKIFADAPYLDTFLASSGAICMGCQQWDANCKCAA
jgi:hypothetical protein